MNSILVAVICNVVAALIVLAGVLSSARNSWKLSLIKFCLTIAGGVGIYFAVPAASNAILAIPAQESTIGALLMNLGVSVASINAILFAVMFLVWFGITAIVCSIVKHILIKSYRNKSENSAKIKRAKSINHKAERLAKKAAWRDMKAQYKASNRWYKRTISIVLGSIVSVLVSLIVLMPFGYIAKDLNKAANGEKAYLEEGFNYTLNGVIDDADFNVFDYIISVDTDIQE